VIRGQAPFEGPFPIGHECVAEIVDLGDAVQGLEVWQRVVVTWHIACGECARCRAGLTAHCEVVPYGAMFGLPVAGEWGGLFSDLVRIPFAESMLVPVPDGLDQRALASAGDNLALALECLAGHLQARPGASLCPKLVLQLDHERDPGVEPPMVQRFDLRARGTPAAVEEVLEVVEGIDRPAIDRSGGA
jgi:threonine dehydrogenase-like Zn-dependent dehydrogenase